MQKYSGYDGFNLMKILALRVITQYEPYHIKNTFIYQVEDKQICNGVDKN